MSGFGWDEDKKTVTASDDVWDRYMEAHPKTPNFRKKGVEHYDELQSIFTGTVANGQFSRAGMESESDDEGNGEDEDEDKDEEDGGKEDVEEDEEEEQENQPKGNTPANKKGSTPASANGKAKPAGKPPAKKAKQTVGDKLIGSLEKLADAVKSGATAEAVERDKAIKAFTDTAFCKRCTVRQRLQFKAHLLEAKANCAMFNSLVDIEEVEYYIAAYVDDE